jgi:flagellum-specific ATP synthase
MATMIRIGAYRTGSDAATDRAIRLRPELEDFLAQPIAERVSQTDSFAELGRIMAIDAEKNPAA